MRESVQEDRRDGQLAAKRERERERDVYNLVLQVKTKHGLIKMLGHVRDYTYFQIIMAENFRIGWFSFGWNTRTDYYCFNDIHNITPI